MTGEWIRFTAVAVLTAAGLLLTVCSVFGVFRFRSALNRMHAAAVGDTLGLSLVLLGLIVAEGFTAVSLKDLIVLVFFWIASPVASHVLARLEVTTGRPVKPYEGTEKEK